MLTKGTVKSFSYKELGAVYDNLSGGLELSQADLYFKHGNLVLWKGRMLTAQSSNKVAVYCRV